MMLRAALAATLVAQFVACGDDGGPVAQQDGGADQLIVTDLGADDMQGADTGSDGSLDGSHDMVADGASPDLEPADASDLASGRCASAQRLVLTKGSVAVNGDTSPLDDEHPGVSCGSSFTLDGPQAYFVFAAKKGQWYKLVLNPDFVAVLYLFTSSQCSESAIDTDCSSVGTSGTTSTLISVGRPEAVYFKALADGDLRVAVDSTTTAAAGTFSLTIDEIAPPNNASCDAATPLTFIGGKAAGRGETHPAFSPNEFSTSITCGTGNARWAAFDGPQAYYRFTADADKSYAIRLVNEAAEGSLYFYVFRASAGCRAAEVDADCASDGVHGVVSAGASVGNVDQLLFQSEVGGDYIIAIDSRSTDSFGSYSLQVDEITAPTNATCATAEAVVMQNGVAEISGDTSGAANEFGKDLRCDYHASFDGPQTYHAFTAVAGKYYRLTHKPEFTSHLYIFEQASCGNAASINLDCKSQGAKGARFGAVDRGSSKSYVFSPRKSGEYVVAVDSVAGTAFGRFDLRIEEKDAPANDRCSTALPLTLVGHQVIFSGDSEGARDESTQIDCLGSSALGGPQLYYSVVPQSDKVYRITLRSEFSAYLYTFGQAGCGDESRINDECGSRGKSGDSVYVPKDTARTLYHRAGEKFIIAVDSQAAGQFGGFELAVEELDLPAHQACAQGQGLSWQGDKIVVEGDTTLALDEFDGPSCGSEKLDGPQLYYRVAMKANQTYWFSLNTTFDDGYLYIVDSCSGAAVSAACGAGGSMGPTRDGRSRSLYFTPAVDGDYLVAVDSALDFAATELGPFRLEIQRVSDATNGSCSAATPIVFSRNEAHLEGFTRGIADEFKDVIKCGGSTAFNAGQVYYRASLVGGVEYTIALKGDFDAQLYLFSSGCDGNAIEADCASGSAGAHLAISAGSQGTLSFIPQADGVYHLVIDGQQAADVGRYAVDITSYVLPTLQAPFALDFEKDGGGLAARGDWQWGQLAFSPSSCDGYTAPRAPTLDRGRDGVQRGMWGTILNDCYIDAANGGSGRACDNRDLTDDSILTFNVALPANGSGATLVYWHWIDGSTSFDYPLVYVDGKEASGLCLSKDDPRWIKSEVDLTAYLGKTVTIGFHWVASAAANRAGWYIDELAVVTN